MRAARSPRVCAVMRWSAQRFNRFRGLGRRLRHEGYVAKLDGAGEPAADLGQAAV